MKKLTRQLINTGIEEPEAKKEISILQKEFSNQEKIIQIVEERIKTRKPIQYLLGKAYFMDFEVKVNEKVLIPRPETEILVEETVNHCCRDAINRVSTALDIGTGSGIIAIALAKSIPDIKIIAIDIEKEIIDLARENAKLNGVEDKIDFKVCDLFSKNIDEIFKDGFDLIISNPPYVKEMEMKKLLPEVYLHEPKIALSGSKENKTGMVYYKRIIELAKQYLCKSLALEIDPPLVNDLKIFLKNKGLNNFEIVKDYGKRERCLFVYP